ncbi:Hypothetical predicted protein [Mytilus galloprovincialis]|uniref:Uncharacterized protein n=1 Tax=Mytilus galloprovincialis TaxID=29158 RepID=A0A8B6EIE3_MYTGA|nr:Hypothetical predicted protein [Mytilus galloprovincialis]
MMDFFDWAALQTKISIDGECIDFGIFTKIKDFVMSNCTIPVDGQWSLWSSVRCSVSCGHGIGIRTGLCDNPIPSGNGNSCVGSDKERKMSQ